MDNRTLVTTDDIVIALEGQIIRLRRVPHWANEERIMWLLELADEHGHFWPLAPSRIQTTHGLYRWVGPGWERRREV